MNLVTDAGTVFAREMGPTLRNPIGLLFTMGQPLVFLLLFGPLLTGTPGVGGSPWQWFVPGILVMLALFGTTGAGYSLLVEMSGGSLERMLVTPLNRAALLVGRTLKEVVTLLAQAVLIIVAVLPLGFRLHPLGTLTGLALLAVFGVGLGSLAFALAIAARKQEELFYGVQQILLFPLVLLSGVLLPTGNAPAWLAHLADVNPVTYIVAAERALFAGDVAALPVLQGTAAALATALLGLLLGTRAMRRVSE
jgi:ABC-2 type transport system permease protein